MNSLRPVFLTMSNAIIVMLHTLVTLQMYNCNYSISLPRLQLVHNEAAQVISEHISPVLQNWHWFPGKYHINLKSCSELRRHSIFSLYIFPLSGQVVNPSGQLFQS